MDITETRSGSRAHAEGMPESRPDPEVPAKARRRRYGAEYKLQILEAVSYTHLTLPTTPYV